MSLTEIKDVMIPDGQTRQFAGRFHASRTERSWRSYFVCWVLRDQTRQSSNKKLFRPGKLMFKPPT